MAQSIKTAIALPKADFEMIERIRKRTGKSRSQILLEAFRAWLNAQRKEQLEKEYAEAYHQKPENIKDLKAFLQASRGLWQKENW